MLIKYLFSAPKGDIPVGADDLQRPFLISAGERHPFLTLGNYFEAIKDFILMDHGRPLTTVLGEHLRSDIGPDSISEILIRTEKHGALYHLASVEIFCGGQSLKMCVSTAVSENGKAWLKHELGLLKFLNLKLALPYLPVPYFEGDVKVRSDYGNESMSMFLTEWFENYYEWHISTDEKGGKQGVCVWDLKNEHWFASNEQGFEIFRQASKILTLYYDIRDFDQIYPWHHAAGDFIVRSKDGIIDVKLTTARKYEPIMLFSSKDTIDPVVALTYFFLNLSIRMRLDRLDGVGVRGWAGGFSVDALIQGFFEGLLIMEAEGGYGLGQVRDLLSLFKGFDQEELAGLFYPLLDMYAKEDPGDFSVIQANLGSHTKELYEAIQSFSLRDDQVNK
ncbi:MAG: hypothetical protein C4B58_02300 [Deltaproteobacteria bacterium]|nr:MAG: hypothetical protein C4B58_02300 [Deltaproteobacteria bacterium]